MNISVFGLGYVGIVNIACLSKLGHKVYGCDIKPHKVALVKDGNSTILEPQIDELMKLNHKEGRIEGSTDAEYCVKNTEMALICVGTPSDAAGKVNLNYILNTTVDIVKALSLSNKKYTLVYRSTIPPGTIEDQILPVVSELLGENIKNLNVVFLPEFLREGSAVYDFFNSARIVAGTNGTADGKEEITRVFGFSKETPIIFTSYRTAEFVKYVDNAYHATKVAFANEAYSIGAKLGVNIKEANEIFLMDTILNISARYLKPGTPFGGSCLPKDTRAIVQLAEKADVDIPFFKGLINSNVAHQKRLTEKVNFFKKEKILIYGLTFKQNTDDIRESPFLILLRDLLKSGKQVKVIDQKLNLLNLRVEFPDIVKYIETDESSALSWSELIVVNDKAILEITKKAGKEKLIINCVSNESFKNVSDNIYNLYEF